MHSLHDHTPILNRVSMQKNNGNAQETLAVAAAAALLHPL